MYQDIVLAFLSNVLFVMSLGVFYSLFSRIKIHEIWKKILMGLQLSVSYEGRKSEDSDVIHIGRMQVSALF